MSTSVPAGSAPLKTKPRPPPPTRRQSLSTGVASEASSTDGHGRARSGGDGVLRRAQSEGPAHFMRAQSSAVTASHAAELTRALQRRQKDVGAGKSAIDPQHLPATPENELEEEEQASASSADKTLAGGIELVSDVCISQRERWRLQQSPEAEDIRRVEIQPPRGKHQLDSLFPDEDLHRQALFDNEISCREWSAFFSIKL